MEGVNINLFGSYGICAVVLIVGGLVYSKSALAGGLSLTVGIIGAIALVISDITHKHKALDAKINGYIT